MTDLARAAAERIRQQVSILTVLRAYGYQVRADGGAREQQFSCDLHGSGRDVRPSARVYPESNSWYCFGCGVTRDAIDTVRAKEGLEFWPAVRLLERSLGLDPNPSPAPAENQKTDLSPYLDPGSTWEQIHSRSARYLDLVTQERSLPMEKTLQFWSVFDRIVYHVDHKLWSESKGMRLLAELNERIRKEETP